MPQRFPGGSSEVTAFRTRVGEMDGHAPGIDLECRGLDDPDRLAVSGPRDARSPKARRRIQADAAVRKAYLGGAQ